VQFMIKIPKQCAELFSLPPTDINGGVYLAVVQTLLRLTNHPYTLPDTPFQTSYDYCLSNPITMNSCTIYLYGCHHQHFYCWQDVRDLIQQLEEPIITTEGYEEFTESLKARVDEFGTVDPEELKAITDYSAHTGFRFYGQQAQGPNKWLCDQGCLFGNEVAAAFQYGNPDEVYALDLPQKTIMKYQNIKGNLSASHLRDTLRYFDAVYEGSINPRVNVAAAVGLMECFHRPFFQQTQLYADICSTRHIKMNVARELYMSRKLQKICAENPQRTILMIVGNDHVQNMQTFLEFNIPDELCTRIESGDYQLVEKLSNDLYAGTLVEQLGFRKKSNPT